MLEVSYLQFLQEIESEDNILMKMHFSVLLNKQMLDWIASFMQDNSFEIELVNLGLKFCNYSRNKYIEVIM